tara:strand:- start:109 stop:411 length:303 start_codon:yes stop_codon:yes gene_type:complete
MKIITAKDFDTAVASNKNVIVQFSADWCGPCKMLSPVLEKFAESNDTYSVFKVDVSESQKLAKKYSVQSIPKVILFTNGVHTKDAVGFMNETKLSQFISD